MVFDSIQSINIHNIFDILGEIKSYSGQRSFYISQVGSVEIDNGYGSFMISLKNKFIKGIWLSGKKESDNISSVLFSNPQITIAEFNAVCPGIEKKYNFHDDEYAYVGKIGEYFWVAVLGNNDKIERVKIDW